MYVKTISIWRFIAKASVVKGITNDRSGRRKRRGTFEHSNVFHSIVARICLRKHAFFINNKVYTDKCKFYRVRLPSKSTK